MAKKEEVIFFWYNMTCSYYLPKNGLWFYEFFKPLTTRCLVMLEVNLKFLKFYGDNNSECILTDLIQFEISLEREMLAFFNVVGCLFFN